jgi:hypothetical protein
MLMRTDKEMFWACDACGGDERSQSLLVLWRKGRSRGPRRCYMAHEGCIDALVRELLTEDDVRRWMAGSDVTIRFGLLTDFDGSKGVEGGSVDATLPKPTAEHLAVLAATESTSIDHAPTATGRPSGRKSSRKAALRPSGRKQAERSRRRT